MASLKEGRKIILAKVIKGKYKDKRIEVKIAPHANDCEVYFDGKKLDRVQSVHIHMRMGELTKLNIITLAGEQLD